MLQDALEDTRKVLQNLISQIITQYPNVKKQQHIAGVYTMTFVCIL